eukprot:963521-Prorocentrum_minimum.AAC.1
MRPVTASEATMTGRLQVMWCVIEKRGGGPEGAPKGAGEGVGAVGGAPKLAGALLFCSNTS